MVLERCSAWTELVAVGGVREIHYGNTQVVVLDGCQVGCAKAIMSSIGAFITGYIVATELRIVKIKDLELNMEAVDIEKVKLAAKVSSR